MTIKEQLTEEMKNAMRAKDMVKLGVIRMILAAVKNQVIAGGNESDESIQKVVASEVKKSRDALSDFRRANRQDLVQAEEEKIKLMSAYLPQQLSDEELKALVKQVKSQLGDANQGQLIGAIIKQAAGRVDGARVATMIKQVN